MVNDDMAGKGAAYAEVRESFFQRVFDSTDGQAAAVVIAGAEADDEKFLLSDFILIARVVQRGITGFVVFFLFLFFGKRNGAHRAEPGEEGCRKCEHQKQCKQFFHGFFLLCK